LNNLVKQFGVRLTRFLHIDGDYNISTALTLGRHVTIRRHETIIAIASLDPDEMDVQTSIPSRCPSENIYGPLQGAKMGATKRFEWIEKRVPLRQGSGLKCIRFRFRLRMESL
jgi:hypothetical protein